ncbi:redox-regulated ATPase YchF, partial [archaeon]
MPLIGIVGKPNVGKTSLFKALTLADVKIANYPFTTTYDPNIGIGYVSVKCVCRELGVKDNPRNSVCIDGTRFIGVKVIDIGGLVPGAYMGRGIGNLFLDHIRRADVLLHVIDVSGSTDAEGNIIEPGKHDPMEDIQFIEEELSMWFFNILKRNWRSIVNRIRAGREKPINVLSEMLSGLKVRREHIKEALREAGLSEDDIMKMKDDDVQRLANKLMKISKPMVVVANKIDIDPGEDNYKELARKLDLPVIPCCCVAEIALKMAAKNGLIKYVPGDSDFKIIDSSKLTSEQKKALVWIKENILDKYGETGVQKAINT